MGTRREGFDRTPRGRVATDRAFEYFGIPRKIRGMQNSLFG